MISINKLTVLAFTIHRQSTSVIRVGVAYVNVHVSGCLKDKLHWAIDKRLWLIINTTLFKTVIPLKI